MAEEEKTVCDSMTDAMKAIFNACKRTIAGYRPLCEQHIALFGEMGSGKTTLLTVFYGYQQAIENQRKSGYKLLAKDTSQGHTLLSSFYNLTDFSIPRTRLSSQEYVFSLRPLEAEEEVCRLVWHDYPGGWWRETKVDFEQADKARTFCNLLQSDAAFFLVDAEKLKMNGDVYLKKLFCNFRDELCRLKEYPEVEDKFPLKHFPRVWSICLSKADLLPDMTAEKFKETVLRSAASELEAIREEIQGMIDNPEYFYLGDDYLLLSAAQFNESCEKVTDINKRIGIDLIAPIAFTIPVKRALFWTKVKEKAVSSTGTFFECLRKLTTGWLKWLPIIGYYISLLDQIAKDGIGSLEDAKMKALKDGDFVNAILVIFEEKMHQVGLDKVYISETDEGKMHQ